jgi:transposase
MGEQTFDLLQNMEETRQRYLKEIRKYAKGFKELLLLKTIPGIGELHSARIVSQVVDPRRFPNKHKYFSYCGLVRHQKESGGRDYGSKKIWGNRVLKCVYKMAARSALRTKDNSFSRYYEHLRSKGMSDQNATNAVCRKIAAISLSLWKNNKKYEDKILSGLIEDKLAA